MAYDELDELLRREGIRAHEVDALIRWANERARGLTRDLRRVPRSLGHLLSPATGRRSSARLLTSGTRPTPPLPPSPPDPVEESEEAFPEEAFFDEAFDLLGQADPKATDDVELLDADAVELVEEPSASPAEQGVPAWREALASAALSAAPSRTVPPSPPNS